MSTVERDEGTFDWTTNKESPKETAQQIFRKRSQKNTCERFAALCISWYPLGCKA